MSNHFRYCDSRNIEMVDSFKRLQFANAFQQIVTSRPSYFVFFAIVIS